MARRKTNKPKQSTPYYVPSGVPPTPLDEMSRDELLRYMAGLRQRLLTKQQRERAYLDRRAARGTHTPTDEVYEQDQVLENEILTLFDHIIQEGMQL